jgi:hypothetical protein
MFFLALVTFFPQWIGFVTTPGGNFYPNPVILDNLLLVRIALAAGVGLNLFMLWRNRLNLRTRLMRIGLDIYQAIVLALLVIGHDRWLAARSSGGLLDGVEAIERLAEGGWELVGMHAYRWAFAIALIVTVIDILASIYRLIKSQLESDFSVRDAVLKIE